MTSRQQSPLCSTQQRHCEALSALHGGVVEIIGAARPEEGGVTALNDLRSRCDETAPIRRSRAAQRFIQALLLLPFLLQQAPV